ncbi:PA14 domain-containing protein [Streptomyces sp. GQFP]|uniref:PA14 domain-containing protein n=1 Tax=Streptomyces sp. GQFP TaxID=2907545 RepID=UPI001F411764|nr:PA14 domain-containing protein [Streptomyces sp. GQFP]UIX32240.1 PA14 domain-containing protein [Streptomyces sp. GQFP]
MNPARRTTPAATTATAVVLATAGALLSTAAPVASAATTCNSPVYKRQFFANTALSGAPKRTDCDSAIAENWGAKAPATGLPKDNFGIRWTVTRDFGSGGPFALTAAAQDGIRVYLDGKIKVNLWKNVTTTQKKTLNLTIPSGKHTLRIDYANFTGNANVNFAYTPRTSASVDKVKPLAPTAPTVTYDKTTGKAKLTWAKNNEMDLGGYRVYRRLTGSSYPSTPLATTPATSYTDTTLPVTGAAYDYSVRAYDKAGNESAGSADKSVTTVDRVAPAVPAGLAITDRSEADGLRLGWSAAAEATSYRVYRADSESGTYTAVGSTDQLSYQDASATVGTTYYYRVSSLDAAGNESGRSTTVSGSRWDQTPPPVVTGLTVTPTEYGFALSWDTNPAPDVSQYVVYAGQIIRDEEDPEGDSVCYAHQAEWLMPEVTSYNYPTLPDGVERCFLVDVYDTSWNSPWVQTRSGHVVSATELDMTPTVPTPEDSPVQLSAATGPDGQVVLNWNSVADATGYQVYRWNPETEAYEKLALTTTGTSYSETAAKGTTHFYWVTALFADGSESAPGGDSAVLRP